MASIASLYNRLNNFDIAKVSAESINETKEKIVELNQEQLFAGKRSDGSNIRPAYSGFTINEKEKKGQPYDRVTLKDTGAFYAGIEVKVEGDKVIERSLDEKNDELFEKYATGSGNIFGLSSPFKIQYIGESLRPVFLKKSRQAIGL
jgi:hypothetical protein